MRAVAGYQSASSSGTVTSSCLSSVNSMHEDSSCYLTPRQVRQSVPRGSLTGSHASRHQVRYFDSVISRSFGCMQRIFSTR